MLHPALQRLGLSEAQVGAVEAGLPVAFLLADAAEGTIGIVRLIPQLRLQVGIYTVKNVGGGLRDLMTLEARASAAARAIGVPAVELLGIEITNPVLRETLEHGGFAPTEIPVPDELGGGIAQALGRVDLLI